MFSSPPAVASIIASGTGLFPNDKYYKVFQFAVQVCVHGCVCVCVCVCVCGLFVHCVCGVCGVCVCVVCV